MPSAESPRPDPGAEPVWLARLKLTGFRNYAELTLAPDRRPVVLTGPNGAGKTNLLEAVSFLSPGRGLRRARLADIARRGGSGGWAVAATLAGPDGETEIGTGLTAENAEAPQRTVRINRAPAPTSQSLLEHLRVVWLTPAMDALFTGPTGDRRRFLDRMVLAIDRQHGERVAAYEKAMRERNRLLEQGSNAGWLSAIEAQMAEHGVAVAAARRECLSLLTEPGGITRGEGSFPAARLVLAGPTETALDSLSATEAEDRLIAAWATGRPADRTAKRTLQGPHLTDLLVTHVPKQAPAGECSTGEQKALLTGIVLAHARLIARLTGATPLLLLDEVGAHLDPSRRADLFAIIADLGCQAWLTGTEPAPFSAFGAAAQHFAVSDGRVQPGEPFGAFVRAAG